VALRLATEGSFSVRRHPLTVNLELTFRGYEKVRPKA
jgi:hypothetical protein